MHGFDECLPGAAGLGGKMHAHRNGFELQRRIRPDGGGGRRSGTGRSRHHLCSGGVLVRCGQPARISRGEDHPARTRVRHLPALHPYPQPDGDDGRRTRLRLRRPVRHGHRRLRPPQVIEGFHGVPPYDAPLGRTREIVDICRQVWRREKVQHHGKHYQIPLPPSAAPAWASRSRSSTSLCANASRSSSRRSDRRTSR